MGDFARRAAEFHADVEGRRADPNHPPFVHLFCSPKADVMALFRTAADRLFKRQVLLPPKEVQIADRSFVVRSSENRINRDPRTAPESQRIGRIPARGDKGADDIFFRTDQRDVRGSPGIPLAVWVSVGPPRRSGCLRS